MKTTPNLKGQKCTLIFYIYKKNIACTCCKYNLSPDVNVEVEENHHLSKLINWNRNEYKKYE